MHPLSMPLRTWICPSFYEQAKRLGMCGASPDSVLVTLDNLGMVRFFTDDSSYYIISWGSPTLDP